jgi:glycosyltransferase involved in cell wall biosynthesis
MSNSREGDHPFRILFVEQNEDQSTGGSHRSQLLNVKNLDRSRYEPVVAYYQDNEFVGTMRDGGVEVHVLAPSRAIERKAAVDGSKLLRPLHVFRAWQWRRAFLIRYGIDLVHLNNSADQGVDTWLPAAKLARIPIVTDIRGDAHGVRGGVRRWLARWFDQMFPNSEYMARQVIQNGLRADRITVVHLGLDFDEWSGQYRRSAEQVRAELGVAPNQLLALMVGNVREWKGQDVVAEAFARVPEPCRQRWVLAFVGKVRPVDRPFLDRVIMTCEDAGFRDQVRILGFRDDVPDLMRASDVVIHASTTPEPAGRVVLEALATGTPVLAANEGGLTEFLDTRDPVGFTHSVDAPEELAALVARVTADPQLLDTMGRRAEERAREFPASQGIATVQTVYETLLRGRRPRGAAGPR